MIVTCVCVYNIGVAGVLCLRVTQHAACMKASKEKKMKISENSSGSNIENINSIIMACEKRWRNINGMAIEMKAKRNKRQQRKKSEVIGSENVGEIVWRMAAHDAKA